MSEHENYIKGADNTEGLDSKVLGFRNWILTFEIGAEKQDTEGTKQDPVWKELWLCSAVTKAETWLLWATIRNPLPAIRP